jgi:NarL family two-component system response regulator LiaR
MDKIKVLIVDDHPMMRDALQTALADETDIEVTGEASNGLEAVQLAGELMPDIIIMDLLMPSMDGLEAIAVISSANPQIKILVSTSLDDEEKVLAAVQAGALGYFPKTAGRLALLEAIRKVAQGIPYLPAEIAVKLFKGIRDGKVTSQSQGVKAVDEPLTERQDQILALLGEGRSDQEIAKALHLEESTVRSHVYRILQRLGFENRAQAVAYVHRRQKTK